MDVDQDHSSSNSEEEESRQLMEYASEKKEEDSHSNSSCSRSSSPTRENLIPGVGTIPKKEIPTKRDFSDSSSESDEDSCNDEWESEDDNFDYTSRLTYKPSPEEAKKLANLIVKFNHNVPPQHEIERTAGTRHLKPEEKEKFEHYAELKTGKFSKEEHKIIKRNWREFCESHGWDDKNPRPFLQMKYKNKVFFIERLNRMRFVQYLAKNLPNRSLYSVYHTFKVIFDPHKKSRYTQCEDNIILEYLAEHKDGNNDRLFADLALILRRTRASVWRRYRLLKNKEHKEERRKAAPSKSRNKNKRVSL
ncbi:hypothetical protein QAD02_009646 [Eretmocerus hayati]|uniref:Uncharacterized protein n=1 Tax=Eretmocerus hayati TaxID=131215 RepID=A0ACC2NB66_9HYME|nr:hypothetical protein QAD02_009646 [Eretmocerus hayati]